MIDPILLSLIVYMITFIIFFLFFWYHQPFIVKTLCISGVYKKDWKKIFAYALLFSTLITLILYSLLRKNNQKQNIQTYISY